MVANFERNVPPLLQKLNKLPADWALVAIGGNKAPYQTGWQHKNLRIKHLIPEVRSGRAKAVGVLCGTPSGGLLFLDHDGASCDALIGDRPLPQTLGVTSGRPGRYQLIYRVPQQWWEHVQTKKVKTGTIGDDGKEEQLEFRWDGCQSVVIGAHPLTGSYQWLPGQAPGECSIAEAPLWAIELMLKDNAFRSPAQPTPPAAHASRYEDLTVPVPVPVPLIVCLSKESRYLLESGIAEGGRNDNGAKLARDLIGTDRYLQSIGQLREGEPRPLLEDYGRRCSPPLSSQDIETIWKSASKSNPTPSCSSEGVNNCIKAFYWNERVRVPYQDKGGNGGSNGNGNDGNGNGGGGKGKPPISAVSLRERILEILGRTQTPSQRQAAFIELAASTGRGVREIEQLAQILLEEIEMAESRQETDEQLNLLLCASASSLDIAEILPAALASPLKLLASRLALRPECYLTALLATVSSLHKVGTVVELNKTDDFEVTPNLFAGIVAPSSQKKSPILKAIATKPLSVLQAKAREEYKEALANYEDNIQQWESLKGDERKNAFPDGKPQKPRQKVYSFSGTTGEALLYQVQAFPSQGLLAKVDELAGLLKSSNQYRNGKGSDEEDLLSFYDGTGATILRADGVRADLEGLLLAILGTIQPSVLQKFLSDCQDSNGKWARFIFVNQPLSAATMSADNGSLSLTPMLVNLYQQIDALPPTTYTLSRDAFQYFCTAYNRLEQLRVTDNLPGMSAVWGKAEGRIGKLAVNLHVISELFLGRTPSPEIPKSIVKAAVKLTKFYAQQVQSLYNQFADPDALAPQLARILDLTKRAKSGWITASDVLRSMNSRSKDKPTADRIRQWFVELVAMGKGQTRGEGRRLEFGLLSGGDGPNKGNGYDPGNGPGNGPHGKNPSSPPTLDASRRQNSQSSIAESPNNQSIQPIVDGIDKVAPSAGLIESVTIEQTVSLATTLKGEVEHLPVLEKMPTGSINSPNAEKVSLSAIETAVVAGSTAPEPSTLALVRPESSEAWSQVADESTPKPLCEAQLWADSSDVLVGNVAEAASAPSEIQFIAPPLCETIQPMEEVERLAGIEEGLAVENAKKSESTRAPAGADAIATADAINIGAASADSSLDATGTDNFPQLGALVWRTPIPSEWNAKTKQRTPFQPGCLCRIVQLTERGAIALCSSDGSQFHISWHAWQSGLFAPYCGQDGS